jgi:putative salt-induced outer membrane protein YdiY
MSVRVRLAIAVTSILAATPGAAQTPSGRPAPAALPAAAGPAAPPLLHAQLDLGFVSTAGNSSVRTLNVAEQFTVRPGQWGFTQTFAIMNGYTAGIETANNLKVGIRADHEVGTRFRVYALGTFYRNRFAGVSRRFEEAGGLAYDVPTGPKLLLDFEAGAGRNQQTGASGPVRQYWVSRLAGHLKVNFTTLAYAEQKVELLSDLEDAGNQLVNTESAVAAPISRNIALKVGYTVRFANQPQPTYKKTDAILSAGLQLEF